MLICIVHVYTGEVNVNQQTMVLVVYCCSSIHDILLRKMHMVYILAHSLSHLRLALTKTVYSFTKGLNWTMSTSSHDVTK
jgi:hypothetical protein